MSSNVVVDTGDGQEFIIEVKIRPQGSSPNINNTSTTHEESPNHLTAPTNPRRVRRSTVYLDPPESDLDGYLSTLPRSRSTRPRADYSDPSALYPEDYVSPIEPTTNRYFPRSQSRRLHRLESSPESHPEGYVSPISAPKQRYLPRIPSRPLRRHESTASRISKRLSRASDVFAATAEYQGFGEPNQMSYIELHDRPVTTHIHKDPDGTLRIPGRDDNPPPDKVEYGWRFYMILFALSMTNLLVALEGTVTSTALPTIVRELGGGSSYVWVSSGYFLASTVLQPLYGQLANIFGRRILILFAVVAFMIGSGISGGAPSISVMIFGRIVQGIGGGGINMLVNLIVCDLVPLRDRGQFMAIVFAAVSVGTGIGPILGGAIVQSTSWRWVFLLNIPVGFVSLIMLAFFLRLKAPPLTGTWRENVAKLDIGGNVIFIISISLILVALAYAGTLWRWQSYPALATLLFGFAGLVVFLFYEESNYCTHPTVPLRLFRNRTSAAAFAITFIHSLLTLLVIYFIPVYFQAVLLSSPTHSGVQMLPTVIVLAPFSAVSGALLSKYGRYKPFHIAGFATITLGLGCFITLSERSPTAAWIMVQLIVAIGSGFSLSTLLPAVQAKLSDQDTAAATATWAFIRQFGVVWGVSIPAAIFNAGVEHLLPRIGDEGVRSTLSGGAAYDHGTKEYIGSFADPLRSQIVSVYSDSLRLVWIFATVMAGLGFALVFLEEEVSLRTEQSNDYGLDKKE